jgi:hypothetical protein
MFDSSYSWPMIGAKEFEHGQERLDPLAICNFGVGVPWTVETAVALEGSQFEPATVFQRTCSGCHAGGGNILQPVKMPALLSSFFSTVFGFCDLQVANK